jgi:hypothetical protein
MRTSPESSRFTPNRRVAHRRQISPDKSASVQVSSTELGWLVGMSHRLFRGLILPAGLEEAKSVIRLTETQSAPCQTVPEPLTE